MKYKNYLFASIGFIAGLGLLIRTGIRAQYMQSQRESQAALIEHASVVNEAQTEDSVKEALKNIIETNPDEPSVADEREYEEYTPIDGIQSLGMAEGKYYLIDVSTRKSVELENIDNAQVSYVKDEDNSEEYNGVFVEKDGEWYLIDSEAQAVAKLEEGTPTPKSKFVIKGGKLLIQSE